MDKHLLEEVEAERDRQDSKWGPRVSLSASGFLRVLGEEFGEACKAANDGDPHGYREELIQVAATALKAVEAYDNQLLFPVWKADEIYPYA